MKPSRYGVLLVNLGTPVDPSVKSVRQFLKDFLSDKRVVDLPRLIWLPILYGVILPFRPAKVALNYQKIWMEEGSPLMVYSRRQQQELQALFRTENASANSNGLQSNELHGEKTLVKVELAMSYGQPAISNGINQLKNWGAEKLIILPLYPQFSFTTTASVKDNIENLLAVDEYHFVEDYHDHPAYIDALTDSIRQKLTHDDKLIFSFHGIPQRLVNKGDPYQRQCEKTAELVAKKLALNPEQWELAYQSRVGKEPWLQPYFDQRMIELAKENQPNIAVVSPGFSVDCLETLEEIAIQNKALFLENGGQRFEYIAALNDSDVHIAMMKSIVNQIIEREH